jgi:hypothetical protein
MTHKGPPTVVEVTPCGTFRVLVHADSDAPEIRFEVGPRDSFLIDCPMSAKADLVRRAIG